MGLDSASSSTDSPDGDREEEDPPDLHGPATAHVSVFSSRSGYSVLPAVPPDGPGKVSGRPKRVSSHAAPPSPPARCFPNSTPKANHVSALHRPAVADRDERMARGLLEPANSRSHCLNGTPETISVPGSLGAAETQPWKGFAPSPARGPWKICWLTPTASIVSPSIEWTKRAEESSPGAKKSAFASSREMSTPSRMGIWERNWLLEQAEAQWTDGGKADRRGPEEDRPGSQLQSLLILVPCALLSGPALK
ncbi:uncharacterized protein N7482_001403 [Penicillium canariense]|uniref:Uncharacterized protein n=1 Tax=Penicillium canariense TaxID=189055 RepID=A0A9W9IJM8_9EURO|nr:uncharacterized protein N7482_001403 [Penicillium canariense]KAJ5175526.1 hypothetical protein N7482_001403 [Penicillium canariense]